MIFNSNKAIYEQIAERLCDDIIAGIYKCNERIPSVREYGISLQVNTNTAVKAYELLARENIIYMKRGLGYFVTEDAQQLILAQRKQEFMKNMLPEMFRQMQLLNIEIDEIVHIWNGKDTLAIT